MKEVIIQCKKFEEWDKETQDKIIEKHRYINVENFPWYEGVYDSTKKDLSEMGYYDIDISFTGFWSQGDGASFTAKLNIEDWIRFNAPIKYKRILKLINSPSRAIDPYAYIKRDRWSHYVHWNTTLLYIDWNIDYPTHQGRYSNIENLLEELEDEIFSHHQDINKKIYKELEDDYDYLTSDEVIKETLIVNEYEFDENGKIW